MSERLRNNLIKYGVTGAVCLAYAAVHCFSRDVQTMASVDLYRTVSDSFTVPGLVCIFSGLITWLANEGAFNGIGFVMKRVYESIMFFGRRGPVETYGDYVEKRQKKQATGFAFLFVVGAVCLAVSGIFVALYYQVYS